MSATWTDIEEHFLPREMRLDMCMSILEQAGAQKIKLVEHRGEINHCCVMPWHNENGPSASLNFDRLTYVCKSCGGKGGLYWLIQTVLGGTYDQARDWLTGVSGLGGKEFDLTLLLQFLDALDSADEQRAPKTIPRYSEKALDPFLSHGMVYPGLTDGVPELGIKGRGIPEANLRAAKVGWDFDLDRVVIPLFWNGDLVGWQSRRIVNDGSNKYESTPDFPRDVAMLGLPEDRRRVIVVESPMTYLKHMHNAPLAASYGSDLSPQQFNHLKWYSEVTVACDNDPAGWRSIEGWGDDNGNFHPGWATELAAYTNVTTWEHDWAADPGDFDEQTFQDIDEQRVPVSIWRKPTGTLRCWRCKQPHTGECS